VKVTAYMRVGYVKRRGHKKLAVNAKPSHLPLMRGEDTMPTVAFAIALEIPDAMFVQAEQVIAQITVPEEMAQVAADVELVPLPAESGAA
jgi:hypothetical protein